MPRSPRACRDSQRGQVLPIVALAGVVLIGVTALAVDLSLQTNVKRQIQNVADAAALAGAHDLYSSGATLGGSDQLNAVTDALATVASNMGWPTTPAGTSCAGYPTASMTTFGLVGQCLQASASGDTITLSTPPANPSNVVNLDTHAIEVDISQTQSTNFAAVLGFASASEKAHAIARHDMGGAISGFALFANQYVHTGNQVSLVNGNVYAGRAVDLQSHGSAGFCANSTGPSDGYILLGAPQFGDGLPASTTGQHNVLPTTSQQVTPISSLASQPCTTANVPGGDVVQAGAGVQPPSTTCPSIAGAGPAFYNAQVKTCEVVPVVLPPAPPPPQPAGATTVYQGHPCQSGHGTQCWQTAPADGVYIVYHTPGCDPSGNCFDLRVTKGISANAITIWLKPGATFDVNMSGNGAAFNVNGPYNAGTSQAGDDHYVVYGETGSSMSIVGNNTPVLFRTGSIYMPGGTVSSGSSAANLDLQQGQAVADTWDVQSGNQPNAEITYNGQYAATTTETFRLVE